MRISVWASSGKWKVYRKGMQKAIKVCRDRDEAIQYASKVAFEMRCELTVSERDGRVDFRIDYTDY